MCKPCMWTVRTSHFFASGRSGVSPRRDAPAMKARLFDTEPIRRVPKRGARTFPIRCLPADGPWPPRDRDPADIAVFAARILAASGRLRTTIGAIAHDHDVDPLLFRFLLLFAETKAPLRIGNIAELLAVSHSTASRTAHTAHAAGLVDRGASFTDQREVVVTLTPLGRKAVTNCLGALRPAATAVLGSGDGQQIESARKLLGRAPYPASSIENPGWRAWRRARWDW
jgi:DNA-binding MarR family transcriptional regulator